MNGKKSFQINKKWVLIGSAALIVVAAGCVAFISGGISVDSDAVSKGEVTKLIKESGTVESESSVIVSAKNPGEIEGLKVSEGDQVKAGDILMTSGETSISLDIKSQQAELSGLQAQYSHARDLANKNKALYDQGALSYEDYQASNTAAEQLSSQLEALKYSIRSYAESSGASGVSAPVSGVITETFVKEGETVSAGESLFEISNLNDTYVKADLIAEDADRIRVGSPVLIYNEDTGFSDKNGSVRKIYIKAQEETSDLGVNQRRVTVEISFGTKDVPRLGSNVDVEITAAKKDNVLRVSDLAVFEMNQKNYVYVISGGKAVLREIKKGIEGEDFTEIKSGLSVGEKVILSPGDEISDGVKVKMKNK